MQGEPAAPSSVNDTSAPASPPLDPEPLSTSPAHSSEPNQPPSEANHADRSSPFSHFSDAPKVETGPSPQPPPDDFVARMRFRAREWATDAAIQTRIRTDAFAVRLTRALSQAGGEINRATGYDQVDALKRRVIERGTPARPSHTCHF
jgi:sensitive to high expression protein 9